MKNLVKIIILSIVFSFVLAGAVFANTEQLSSSATNIENIVLPVNSYSMNSITLTNDPVNNIITNYQLSVFKTKSLYNNPNNEGDLSGYKVAIAIGTAFTVLGILTGISSIFITVFSAYSDNPYWDAGILMSWIGFALSVPIGTPIWAVGLRKYREAKKKRYTNWASLSINGNGVGLQFSW